MPYMAEYRRLVQVEGVQLRDLPRKPHIYGRAQPDFLGMFKGLSGTVAPVDVWACSRTGLYWEKVEAAAFAGVNTRPRHHEPVPLDYRHHAKTVLGLSRRWELDNDGALHGTFDMGSHPSRATCGAGGATWRPGTVDVSPVPHPLAGTSGARRLGSDCRRP